MELKTIAKIISFASFVLGMAFVWFLHYFKISVVSEQFWILLAFFVGYGFINFIEGVVKGDVYDGK